MFGSVLDLIDRSNESLPVLVPYLRTRPWLLPASAQNAFTEPRILLSSVVPLCTALPVGFSSLPTWFFPTEQLLAAGQIEAAKSLASVIMVAGLARDPGTR